VNFGERLWGISVSAIKIREIYTDSDENYGSPAPQESCAAAVVKSTTSAWNV